MSKKYFCCPVVTVLIFTIQPGLVFFDGDASANINDQVAQLDFNTATLDDVIEIFGEPTAYKWGSQIYNRGDLPVAVYCLWYPDSFFIVMTWDSVNELRFESPALGYIWTGGIHVGSSLNDVLSVVGQPTETVVGQPCGWSDGVLYKDIDGTTGYCYYCRSDQNVRFFFSNYNVSALYLTGNPSGINPINEFDDVRSENLSQYDFSDRPELIPTLTFNSQTIWPGTNKMPLSCDPNVIMTNSMNPGLGVRQLHQQGITGAGINVAIIDQPMYLDHPEYAGKIAAYYDTGCGGESSSMHGPAVASLLAGVNCGTAPGARIYYAAVPSWTGDAAYYADAIDWIIAQNQALPASEKIRVISVSAAPSGAGSPFTYNQAMWDDACARAEAANILVLDCTSHRGFIGRCWYDSNNPEDVTGCTPGAPGQIGFDAEDILVPCSVRTTAQHYDYHGLNSYIYWGRGGLSWSIPYCAGVLAMGWQINPELTGQQMRELLFESAYITNEGAKIINPPAFIDLVTQPTCQYELVGDLNNDCRVNYYDFAIMAENWLIDCYIDPNNPACIPK